MHRNPSKSVFLSSSLALLYTLLSSLTYKRAALSCTSLRGLRMYTRPEQRAHSFFLPSFCRFILFFILSPISSLHPSSKCPLPPRPTCNCWRPARLSAGSNTPPGGVSSRPEHPSPTRPDHPSPTRSPSPLTNPVSSSASVRFIK